jgi:hypothetical protein
MSEIQRWEQQSQKVRIIHMKKTLTLEQLMSRQPSDHQKQNRCTCPPRTESGA